MPTTMQASKWKEVAGFVCALAFFVVFEGVRRNTPELVIPFGLFTGALLYVGSGAFLKKLTAKQRTTIWFAFLLIGGLFASMGALTPQYPWRLQLALFIAAACFVPFLIDLALLLLLTLAKRKNHESN
jgi:hypothetical protein